MKYSGPKELAFDVVKLFCTVWLVMVLPTVWIAYSYAFYTYKAAAGSVFWSVPKWVSFIVMLPLLYSLIRQAVIYNASLRDDYNSQEERSVKDTMLWIVKKPLFWIKAIAFSAVIILIKADKTHLAPFAKSVNKQDLIPFLLLAFGIYILAYCSACSFWTRDKVNPPENCVKAYLKGLGNVLFVYFPAGLLCCFVTPYMMSFLHAFEEILSVKLVLAAVVLLSMPPIYRVIRALRQRKKLFRDLKRLCEEKGFTYTEPIEPYKTVLKQRDGKTFDVYANGKAYSCKLFCNRRKKLPIRLNEDGNAEIIHEMGFSKNVSIYEYSTTFKYGFESENTKILIICPSCEEVFVQLGKNKRVLDNADHVWDYTVYNAKAFINALERGTLNK